MLASKRWSILIPSLSFFFSVFIFLDYIPRLQHSSSSTTFFSGNSGLLTSFPRFASCSLLPSLSGTAHAKDTLVNVYPISRSLKLRLRTTYFYSQLRGRKEKEPTEEDRMTSAVTRTLLLTKATRNRTNLRKMKTNPTSAPSLSCFQCLPCLPHLQPPLRRRRWP